MMYLPKHIALMWSVLNRTVKMQIERRQNFKIIWVPTYAGMAQQYTEQSITLNI